MNWQNSLTCEGLSCWQMLKKKKFVGLEPALKRVILKKLILKVRHWMRLREHESSSQVFCVKDSYPDALYLYLPLFLIDLWCSWL